MTYPVLLGAIRVTSNVNDTIEIQEAGVTIPVGLSAGTWYLRGDGGTDDFCKMLKDQLDAAGANTYSVTPSFSILSTAACCAVTIAVTGGALSFSILWASTGTTFDEALLGFASSNNTGATTYTGTRSAACVWVSTDIYRDFEVGQEVPAWVNRAQTGYVHAGKTGTATKVAKMGFDFVHRNRIMAGVGGATYADFQTFHAYVASGLPFEIHACAISSGTTLVSPTVSSYIHGTMAWWFLDEESAARFFADRMSPGVPLYSFDLTLFEAVV
jgi:hypothetical protein